MNKTQTRVAREDKLARSLSALRRVQADLKETGLTLAIMSDEVKVNLNLIEKILADLLEDVEDGEPVVEMNVYNISGVTR